MNYINYNDISKQFAKRVFTKPSGLPPGKSEGIDRLTQKCLISFVVSSPKNQRKDIN